MNELDTITRELLASHLQLSLRKSIDYLLSMGVDKKEILSRCRKHVTPTRGPLTLRAIEIYLEDK